jgi:hypothetical protein
MWHSARWNTEVDLRGKKVAVIGNGSSTWVIDLLLYAETVPNNVQVAISSHNFRRPICASHKLLSDACVVHPLYPRAASWAQRYNQVGVLALPLDHAHRSMDHVYGCSNFLFLLCPRWCDFRRVKRSGLQLI